MHETESIRTVKGIGEKKAELFEKLSVYQVSDILFFYPRMYVTYPPATSIGGVKVDQICAVRVRVRSRPKNITRRITVTIAAFACEETGEILEAVWYRSPYMASKLKPGDSLILYGKVIKKNHKLTMNAPAVFELYEYAKIEGKPRPVYALTAGLSNNMLISAVDYAIKNVTYENTVLPDTVATRHDLYDHASAIRAIHFPKDFDDLKKGRDRLVFEEFYTFLKKLCELRENEVSYPNNFEFCDETRVLNFLSKLPYTLTGAQKRTLREILNDMRGENVSYRLIQGDVGSGKTIVAFLAMVYAALSGYSALMMAPTSVLALQHYETFLSWIKLFGPECDIEIVILTARSKNKSALKKKIASEKGLIIVGTQALISDGTEIDTPAIVITDEQHRFGVMQRERLALKGTHPHELAMSATPIPRSLAMILYAGVNVSIIDEMPENRLPIKSFVADESYRVSTYRFINKEIESGRQVYVICPLVEPSEDMDLKDVETETEMLRAVFPGLRIEGLNGRMPQDKKDEIMSSFAAGETDILVSTTVVEVGINVPNATFMLIENSERFGLATLHQLRGRVGRGEFQSYCVFMTGKNADTERLKIMGESDNGFEIADYDLSKRGPGDFFGIRQSGEIGFKLADIYQDAGILRAAAEEVKGSDI